MALFGSFKRRGSLAAAFTKGTSGRVSMAPINTPAIQARPALFGQAIRSIWQPRAVRRGLIRFR